MPISLLCVTLGKSLNHSMSTSLPLSLMRRLPSSGGSVRACVPQHLIQLRDFKHSIITVTGGDHVGQQRYRTFPFPQNILLDRAAQQFYIYLVFFFSFKVKLAYDESYYHSRNFSHVLSQSISASNLRGTCCFDHFLNHKLLLPVYERLYLALPKLLGSLHQFSLLSGE